MDIFDTISVLLVLSGLAGYFNHKFVHLPFTIGLMAAGLVASGLVMLIDHLAPGLGWGAAVRGAILDIDFTDSVMRGMLGGLLFAGALHINLNDLLAQRGPILTLASVGVVLSTAALGLGAWWLFDLIGHPVPLPWCLVFGAVLAPTDPIAVLGIMKSVGAPKPLESQVAGESLFNDGVGVVVFTALVMWASTATGMDTAHGDISAGAIAGLFFKEVVGGIGLGLGAGYLVFRALRSLDEPNLEILISVALVTGMTTVAFALHLSAPLACVFAGLLIGNHGRRLAMSTRTREALDLVWGFIDEALNAILFLLVGFELLQTDPHLLAPALLVIPLALTARAISVTAPLWIVARFRPISQGTRRVLIWGGLKGGISVALALSLPDFPGRGLVLAGTYVVVIFSVLVQGLTIGPLLRRVVGPAEDDAAPRSAAH